MNMNVNDKWSREETWDRIVDGDLDCGELRELIQECDLHPELWRRCALAFLEEQALKQEFESLGQDASLFDELHATQATLQPLTSMGDGPVTESSSSSPVATSQLTETRSNNRASRWSVAMNYLAFAASVALAFSIGWQASRRLSVVDTSSGSRTISSVVPGQRSPATATERPQFVSDTLDNRTMEEMRVKAIAQALSNPNAIVPIDQGLPKELRELQRQGRLNVQASDGFIPVSFGGVNALVPVQSYDIRPQVNDY